MSNELKQAFWGGGVAAIVIAIGSYAVGHISNSEAVTMLKAMLPSTRFLCAAVVTSASTILALLLTMISFSNSSKKQLRSEHYDRVKLIAKLACAAFIAAIILLLFVNLPIEKAPEKIALWLRIIYYGVLTYTSLLGGLLITIILLLYQSATNVILVVHPSGDAASVVMEDQGQQNEGGSDS